MSATPKMTGGSIDLAAHNLKTSIEQIDTPWKVAVGFLLILSVGYGAKLGDMLDMNKISLRSLGGRLIGLVAVVLVINFVGWIYGLMAAVALLVAMRGYTTAAEEQADVTEAFSDLVVKERQGSRWFVEKVLGENPELIEEDRVETTAVHS